jgi:AcrR family transcriptional regulator
MAFTIRYRTVMVKSTGERHSSRDLWIEAAVQAIISRGVEGVAVEPLAAAMGITKGSFYWHFRNRSELLSAAVLRWEERSTLTVIRDISPVEEPRERLKLLLERAFRNTDDDRGELAILAAADDPVIAPVVERVKAARLMFLRQIYLDLGFRPTFAKVRAEIAYASYLGHLQLHTDHGAAELSPRLRRVYREELLTVLTATVSPSE